ncbi:MAG: hypothetical protein HOJ85_11030 [Ilumatobacter sp.]|uniref:hypothetical protein n=1 Tax=Ilumatobacter sp. TaxID=1967498 RepID=UPI003750AE18|nr:hypothetical protein [Ilumatobacter sp.]
MVFARLVQQHGEHRLAVQAVAACSRDGRSRFSREQIDAILDLARGELGDDAVDDVIKVDLDLELERSEIYRAMWSVLQPLIGQLAPAEEASG